MCKLQLQFYNLGLGDVIRSVSNKMKHVLARTDGQESFFDKSKKIKFKSKI